MTDPLSVAASAASLAQLCGTLISALKVFHDSRNVEFRVQILKEEINTLGGVLSRVAETFEANPMQTPFQKKHEGDVQHLLDRCGKTLKALNQIISGLEGRKGLASNLLKQLRVNRVTQDITILKANLHSCTEMLQVSLLTINMIRSREDNDDIGIQLQELSLAIREVKNSLSSRNYQVFRGDPLQVDNPLARDVKSCLISVEDALNSPKPFSEPLTRTSPLDKTYTQEPTIQYPEVIQPRPNDNVSGNKETLDWLRTKRFSPEHLDASRPEAVRLAVEEGRVAVVHVLVNQVSKTQARRALLADAMQLAVSINQLEILKSLITREAGPSIDDILESGHTPLIAAILAGNHQIVELLLRYRANTEARCAEEITPLTHAVKARDQGIVQFLLHGTARIDATTWDWTPLHFAVNYGDRDMVELLLKNNADIEASCPLDFSQKTSTQPAGLHRSTTTSSTTEVERYCRPLFRASINEDDMMVQLLLERGADPDAKNSGEATALICAAEEQLEEIVELLLKHKASVHAKDHWEWTPLHRAQVKPESERVTELLLHYKAEVDARCGQQRTPLHWAAEWGNTSTVPILLKHKADIEAKDGAGRTPLHVAIEYRQTEMVIELVKNGADVTAQNSEGHDALAATIHVEKQRKCPEIITYLKKQNEREVKEEGQSDAGFRHPIPLN
ncbi:hypothetical protein MMC22_008184 [Lobaria immixta]|nr:hypothetical protein [Lobaria immixta]